MKFDKPYFVTPHAVIRFRERVANLSAKDIILTVQAALQNPGEPVEFEYIKGQLAPIFACTYNGFTYYVPVVKGEKGWPAVPTIYGYGCILHEKIKKGKKKGCEIHAKNN